VNKTTQPDQPDLFDDESDDVRLARTRTSMLWAAYADALGFISELVDERGLKRRTKGAPLDHLMSWKRRVGGRGGVDVDLPAGCWSDDTQLRMAVSRAINRFGFDVESFARIELPVWPSYALGGGRASKAAAASLGKPDALWYANTFSGWVDAGGNGAAMRVQPHVWSAPDLSGGYTLDVIVDSVCTHGHPRAIVGACFHAATLAHCLRFGVVPDLETAVAIAADLGQSAFDMLEGHRSLGTTWRGLWEEATGKSLEAVWGATVRELSAALQQAADAASDQSVADAHSLVCDRLSLRLDERRGSGILTPVAAWSLARAASNPHEAVLFAVNALGTDTDTIATMAGALLGACHAQDAPPAEPLDAAYLLNEADRLVRLSREEVNGHHSYPDLLTWTAPPTQADALVTSDDRLLVEGLGPVTEQDHEPVWTPRRDFAWQWVRTAFGQTLLIKRRSSLRSIGAGNTLTPPSPPPSSASGRRRRRSSDEDPYSGAVPLDRGINVDTAVEFAKAHIADNGDLGYTLRRVARDGTLGDLVALVTALREDLRR
jgi:ADP-ribosylglycohydrolase